MRASRLVEMVVRLQLRGGASASELADALGVSVRTVYRDVEALSAAGVPVWTETGRNGGVRIDPAYRVAGLPRLEPTEARGVLFGVVPAIAEQLGLDAGAADRTLLPAMEHTAEAAARVVRDRLLVEPSHWFVPPDETPALPDLARAVWECRRVRLTYRGAEQVLEPLGLVLKGSTWYVLGRAALGPDRAERLLRLSRVEAVALREDAFARPEGFDLDAAWTRLREAFLASLPEYAVAVRLAPAAEPLLPRLDEARLAVPLPAGTPRDADGWALLTLRFETLERAVRHLLRLGTDVEALGPPALRERMAETTAALAERYR